MVNHDKAKKLGVVKPCTHSRALNTLIRAVYTLKRALKQTALFTLKKALQCIHNQEPSNYTLKSAVYTLKTATYAFVTEMLSRS